MAPVDIRPEQQRALAVQRSPRSGATGITCAPPAIRTAKRSIRSAHHCILSALPAMFAAHRPLRLGQHRRFARRQRVRAELPFVQSAQRSPSVVSASPIAESGCKSSARLQVLAARPAPRAEGHRLETAQTNRRVELPCRLRVRVSLSPPAPPRAPARRASSSSPPTPAARGGPRHRAPGGTAFAPRYCRRRRGARRRGCRIR